ncbi:MAG: selenocysteine lyase/cysteine desulfurase [Arenicella sp.]|jgi:selenocysteine lyase/cysteine desulfurase
MQSNPKFIGVETQYPTAEGKRLPRLHLDGAASPLASAKALQTISKLLPHYSNAHSYVHSSAQVSSKALEWAHQTVLKFVGANEKEYAAVFTGAGTTAAINRIARGLHHARPERNLVLVSSMEHHANDLPHRQFGNEVIYLPLEGEGANSGAVDLECLRQLCQRHANQINYIAVSSISNVSGISNPVQTICKIAHDYDILVLVDAAQSVAHGPTELDTLGADFLVFSGHKVYTPMAPGVLVAKRQLLKNLHGQDLGGGSVSRVSFYDFDLSEDETTKEESGTQNIVGAIALAAVLDELMHYQSDQLSGLEAIKAEESGLMLELLEGLQSIQQLTVYGDQTLPRSGALAFNHCDIDHGLLASILNDYFAIAVRNECFCAHPYVSSMLKDELWQLDLSHIAEEQQEHFINRKRGMVRASLSLYNTRSDVQRLISAISKINSNMPYYTEHYRANNDGSYSHSSYKLEWQKELGLNL